MAEVGIDIATEQPKIVTADAVKASDVVITMGCGDTCPFYPASATKTGYSKTQPAKESMPHGRSDMRSGVGSRASSGSCSNQRRISLTHLQRDPNESMDEADYQTAYQSPRKVAVSSGRG